MLVLVKMILPTTLSSPASLGTGSAVNLKMSVWACSGAQMILLSRRCREKAGELARKIEYVEIAHERQFTDVFAESMAF